MPLRKYGFPYRAPTVPKGVVVPREPSKLGADYDTEWARTPVAAAARSVITEGPMRLLARSADQSRRSSGLDRLDDLTRLDDPPPVIFAPNHHSHLDTGLMIRSVPARLATRPRGRRGRRLLLRQALEGGVLGARVERDPDRS